MYRKFLICLFVIGALITFQASASAKSMQEQAIFAGGCFWCMEHPFEEIEGVSEVVSGYTGGSDSDPTYEEVSGGRTGHLEAIRITYDPEKVAYSKLLDIFWRQIDPTDDGGQFVDRGTQYSTAIFYTSEEQRKVAEGSRAALEESGNFSAPIVTPIIKAAEFYLAEAYHQDYYKTNPVRYKYYRWGSGRDQFLDKVWDEEDKERPAMKTNSEESDYKKPSDEELREKLTPLQYNVTQEEGTERAFENEFWDNKKEGIYVGIVSGEPLFSSIDKFKSGTGWPSFTKPLDEENIVEREDNSLFITRIEVRSKHGDSHLGHIFDDGPRPTGQRYCINSAALRFIPKEDMEKEGYGDYKTLFGK